MKDKLLKIFDIYSKRKAGYIPLDDRDELADEIVDAFEKGDCPKCGQQNCLQHGYSVDWAGLDPVKWGELDAVGTEECKATTRKYVVFGDTEDITITP